MFFTDPSTDTDATAPLYTCDGLTRVLATTITKPTVATRADYLAMSPDDRRSYDQSRINYLSGGIVVTTRQLMQAKKDLTQRLTMNAAKTGSNRVMMLSGDPTLGKTTSTIALMRYIHTTYRKQFPDFARHGRVPVVYIAVPTGCTPKTLLLAFLRFFGLDAARAENADSIKFRVLAALRTAHTQLIVIDELQNLAPDNRGNGESIDVLKQLQDGVRATFIYAGIDLSTNALLSGVKGTQLRGRGTTTELARFRVSTPEHAKEWTGIIDQFEKNLLLADHEPRSLLKHATYLWERTNGSIGSLSHLLTAAAVDLITDRSNPIEAITTDRLATITLDDTAEQHYTTIRTAQNKKAKR